MKVEQQEEHHKAALTQFANDSILTVEVMQAVGHVAEAIKDRIDATATAKAKLEHGPRWSTCHNGMHLTGDEFIVRINNGEYDYRDIQYDEVYVEFSEIVDDDAIEKLKAAHRKQVQDDAAKEVRRVAKAARELAQEAAEFKEFKLLKAAGKTFD